MAIRGEFLGGEVSYAINGTVSMVAKVELIDDVFGRLSVKTVPMTDPAVMAQVTGFIESMLPGMSQQIGIAVTLPPTAPEVAAPDGGGE